MTNYYIIDDKAMSSSLAQYKSMCHGTIKHRKRTLTTLAKFERDVLRRFDLIKSEVRPPKKDLWRIFSNLKPKKGTTFRPAGSDIKSAFRAFIASEQGNRCCYCQRWLLNNGNAKPIEHILPRESFEHYAFHFWNLAVACVDCNSLKSAKVWCDATKKGQREYPRPSSFTEMFHPRFHRFKDHVRFIRVQTNDHSITLYRGITGQGQKLCKDLLKDIAAKEVLINGNSNLKGSLETIDRFEAEEGSKLAEALLSLQSALSDVAIKLINR